MRKLHHRLQEMGGDSTWTELPDLGIRGSTHALMMEDFSRRRPTERRCRRSGRLSLPLRKFRMGCGFENMGDLPGDETFHPVQM